MRLLSVPPSGLALTGYLNIVSAPHISGGVIADGSVVFENSDGSSAAPIAIPNGVLVFVDNGDSTWSVGP